MNCPVCYFSFEPKYVDNVQTCPNCESFFQENSEDYLYKYVLVREEKNGDNLEKWVHVELVEKGTGTSIFVFSNFKKAFSDDGIKNNLDLNTFTSKVKCHKYARENIKMGLVEAEKAQIYIYKILKSIEKPNPEDLFRVCTVDLKPNIPKEKKDIEV